MFPHTYIAKILFLTVLKQNIQSDIKKSKTNKNNKFTSQICNGKYHFLVSKLLFDEKQKINLILLYIVTAYVKE